MFKCLQTRKIEIRRTLYSVFLLNFSIILTGCSVSNYAGMYGDEYHRGFHYHPGYFYKNYSPIYNYQNNSTTNHVRQNIKNSINITGTSHYNIDVQETRSYYIDEPLLVTPYAMDATVRQVNVVERKRFSVPLCRTVVQAVSAAYYDSFQYVSCQ